jgi:16S rRNA (cytosine1402-N4)-methyltransferase
VSADHLHVPDDSLRADDPSGHDPVLMDEVLKALLDRQTPPQVIVDCTLGRAGHATVLAERLIQTRRPDASHPSATRRPTLVGLDCDPRNLDFARTRLARFIDGPDAALINIRLFHANFAQLDQVLDQLQLHAVDGILADLGVSTNQIFDPRYGMAFSIDGPLDMRLDPRTTLTAEKVINTWPESEIADALYQLADERLSRRIARKVADARRIAPITTTRRLAEIVRTCFPPRRGHDRAIDPATRTFMALRILVNSENQNLADLLDLAPMRLAHDGRLAIISFHSAEDRQVKQAFRSRSTDPIDRPDPKDQTEFQSLTRKPIEPTPQESARNPRARSAKLRVLRRRLASQAE